MKIAPLDWIISYIIILATNIFFMSDMHHFRAILPKWVLTPTKETSSHIFKMDTFSKFFRAFMRHKIRQNTGRQIKLFSEVFINKIFKCTFVLFVSNKSLLDANLKFWHLRPTQFHIFIVLLQNVKILKHNDWVLCKSAMIFPLKGYLIKQVLILNLPKFRGQLFLLSPGSTGPSFSP